MPDRVPDGIRFQVLGPLRATRGGYDIPLGPAKQRAVLAVLLLKPGWSVLRDEIVAGVWGDLAPASASNLVATYVVGLRRALGPPNPIVSSPGGYLLHAEPGQLDLRAFDDDVATAQQARDRGDPDGAARAFAAALDRWRGPALEGVPGPHADRMRDHLTERYQAVLEQRILVEMSLGRHAESIAELSRLVALHPLRESLHGTLMLALCRSGRQAEALTVFHGMRRRLVDELGVEPGAPLRDLYQQIITDDLPATPPRTTASPDPSTPPHRVPHQLPAALADFTGRTGELRRLTDRLATATTASVCVITGSGGIGKTALAVLAAHLSTARFPDGQLYVNLRGTQERPLTPEEVLERLLTDLGARQDQLPPDLDRRAVLLRTWLSDRRVLMVLDDAADSSQVRLALPGRPGSATLITSRTRMTDLPDSLVAHLDELDAESARAILTAILGAARVAAEPDATTRIVRLCGGLPLALRAAGARLVSRPAWTLQTFADRVADERRRLDELRAGDLEVRKSLRISYQALPGAYQSPADAARVFRLLGVLPAADISVHAAAAVLDVPTRQAEQALELLADVHLVEPSTAGRYRFHDLLHLFAGEQAERQERPAALDALRRRALDYYRAAAYEADLLLRPGRRTLAARWDSDLFRPPFRTVIEAVEWWATERATLVAVALDAAHRPEVDPSTLASLLTDLRSFLHRRGHWDDWQALAHATRAAGRLRADVRAEAEALLELGTLATVHDQPVAAEGHLQDAVRAFREIEDDLGEGRALNNLGVLHTDRQRYAEAATVLRQCLHLQRASADRYGECITLDNLAFLHLQQEDYARARTWSERSIRLHEQVGLVGLSTYAVALGILGGVHSAAGRHPDALDAMGRALDLTRQDGNRYREAYALTDLGCALHAAGQSKRAVESFDSARALQRELGNQHGEAYVLRSLSPVLLSLGQRAASSRCRQEADELLAGPDQPVN